MGFHGDDPPARGHRDETSGGTDWRGGPFVTIFPSTTLMDAKEAFGVPAQTKPGSLGTALVKAALAAASRLASALGPQPVLQPVPVRVKAGRRR